MATSSILLPISTAGNIVTVPSPAQLPASQPIGAIRYSISDSSLYTFDGTNWQLVAGGGGGGSVISVNGQTGVVMLITDDIPEGAANFYYTTSRLQTDLNSGSLDASFNNLSAAVISNNVNIEDNIIILNSAVVGTPTLNAGIEINRGTSSDAQLLWDESIDRWEFGIVSSMKPMLLLTDFSANAPMTFNNLTGNIALAQATTVADGYLSATDWNTFESAYVQAVVNATSSATSNTLVKRDGFASFSASNITSNLTGNVTGNVSGTSNNVTGVVAIANGGSGQSNQQAGINNLTNIGAATAGDVFQFLGGNAQFAPYVPAGSTGSPNTLPYYNNAGNLVTLPGWTIENTLSDGIAANLQMTAPVDFVNLFPHYLYANIQVITPQSTNFYHPEAFHIDMTSDIANAGFDLNSMYGIILNQGLQGDGTTAFMSGIQIVQEHGTGASSGNTSDAVVSQFNLTVNAGHTITGNANLIGGVLTATGTVQGTTNLINVQGIGEVANFTAISSANSTNAVNNMALLDINTAGSVGGQLNTVNVQNFGPVAGNTFMMNLNNSGTLVGNLIQYSAYNNGSVGTDYFGGLWANDGTVVGQATGLSVNQNGAVSGQFTGINVFSNADLGTTSGDNHNLLQIAYNSGHTYHGNLTGINLNFISTDSTDGSIAPININNDMDAQNIRGILFINQANAVDESTPLTLNTSGNSRTMTLSNGFIGSGAVTDDAYGYRLSMDPSFTATDFHGSQISVQGTFSNSITGISIDVSNAVNSNTGNGVRSIETDGGTWNLQSEHIPIPNDTFDIGNLSIINLDVQPGNPITGDEIIVQAFVTEMSIQDDVSPGPIGIGFTGFGAINNLGIAVGKTVSAPMQSLIVVATVQPTPYTDGGTIDDYRGIDVPGILSFGGSVVVNKYTGLHMGVGFDSLAAANWGILVDGTTAENYLNKLAIGTSSQTAASGLDLDVNGQVGVTAIGAGFSVAEGSNAKMGVATMVSGTVTVSTTALTANSRIFLTVQFGAGSIGTTFVANNIPGTSFDIVSTSSGDNSTVAWLLIEAI